MTHVALVSKHGRAPTWQRYTVHHAALRIVPTCRLHVRCHGAGIPIPSEWLEPIPSPGPRLDPEMAFEVGGGDPARNACPDGDCSERAGSRCCSRLLEAPIYALQGLGPQDFPVF